MSWIFTLKIARKKMAKRSRGLRSGSRHKLSRPAKERGLSPITRSLQSFDDGDTVNVVIDPSYHKGQPHHRFHGLTGKITGNQGKAYLVRTRVGNMEKDLIVQNTSERPIKETQWSQNHNPNQFL